MQEGQAVKFTLAGKPQSQPGTYVRTLADGQIVVKDNEGKTHVVAPSAVQQQ
ncbi:Protein of unknown function [Pyronema omphalodes CBS 100304]|uniref:Hypervirulence associated protein TUDOR domain-containing protein n=1 Tax=Pyronema omphalodes (strain CBS 100304) TaxID=1076935 RepID=U4L737_PYROM|nr:Protein of unknown function [Pyronema omphalodes CBS 100304]